MLETRSEMTDDPFIHAFGITREMNSVMWRYIEAITNSGDTDFIADEVSKIKESIMDQPPTASKFRTYQTLNPTLEVHPLYSTKSPTIPDYLRINFTRYRLSSHRLKIEIGRWSHTPRDQRVCSCGTGVQDELHIFECPNVRDIFDSAEKEYSSPSDIFDDATVEDLQVLYKVLDKLCESDEQQLAE